MHNPTTGYVSPQFHIVFDPTFAMVSGRDGNIAPSSLWQAKCGFTKDPVSRFAHTRHNEASPDVINPGMPPTGREGVNMEDHAPPLPNDGNGGTLNIGSEAETPLPRETSPETDPHYPTAPSQSLEEQPQSNRQLRQEIQDPNQGRASMSTSL
jgi:hypothetical protein